MHSYTYTIEGNPIALQRCRVGQRRVWDSQKAIKFACGLGLLNQHENRPKLMGPLILDITFYMEFPKAVSVKKRNELVGTPHFCRPDFSNMLKFYEDLAQDALLFHDDAQIFQVTGRKIYDLVPRTVFTISEFK